MLTRRQFLAAGSTAGFLASSAFARANTSVRIATLKGGTVAWEIDTIVRNGFDQKHGISLSVVPVAGKLSADVLLAAGEADVIVTDWIWVSRQRHAGADYTFFPYSRQVGSIIVMAQSELRSLADLKGKSIGVAGGPTDKSWILLRALAKMENGFDLANDVIPVYAAPALLNEKLLTGEIEAVITFWHFAAVLKANGAREIANIAEAAIMLGLDPETPLLGYVYSEKWSRQNADAAQKLAAASKDAKALLARDDAEWTRLKPMMNYKTDAEYETLKAGFRAGIPNSNLINRASAEKLFSLLGEYGGTELVGEYPTLAPGTFASG